MDNQHKMITGYRDLNRAEIELINKIKAMSAAVEEVCLMVENHVPEIIDRRWLAIARTDLQKGFMALVRAVAKPEGF